jgi:hypothetical protein
MSIVSLVIAPTLAHIYENKDVKKSGIRAANSKPVQSIMTTAPEINPANTIYLK